VVEVPSLGWMPGGSTRVAAVIGDPVRHSLSPLILNTAFRETDLDWVFVALPVREGEATEAVAGMRALGIEGMSVTMPHKSEVAEVVDQLSPEAEKLHAVNCIARDATTLVGHNTDGPGFLAALRAETGFDPAGQACAVMGGGGAARAVIVALAGSGAREVVVVNRTAARGVAAAALAGDCGRVGTESDLGEMALIVNATSVGMARRGEPSDGAMPFDPGLLSGSQVLADLVYQPLETPLLAAARRRGVTAVNGLGMLVHQAAASFELWTGTPAPVDAMAMAVAGSIADR